MDFGEILDAWEKSRKNRKITSVKKSKMARWLEAYPPQETTEKPEKDKDKIEERRKLKEMRPQKKIDLHGLTVQEALGAVDKFIKKCKSQGIKKVLIIHGKGHHSTEGPVLPKRILQYIQKCPLTGEHGYSSREQGGKGALWVIIREN